jgi:hypothetical protein
MPSASNRAITSVAEPGPVGTMSRIGRVGQVCAGTCACAACDTMAKPMQQAMSLVSKVWAPLVSLVPVYCVLMVTQPHGGPE